MMSSRLPLVASLVSLVGFCAAVDVPVRRVVLFSSGVGYFEHAGKVDGSTTTDLRFKTAQINDVLKSLVVEDKGGGVINTVAYPSQDPLNKTLKSFQLDLSGSPTLGNLLAQLRGAKISVDTADQKLEGTVLGVETQRRIVGERGDAIDSVVLNLITGAMVRSVPLDTVRNLTIQDPELQAEVERALTAIAQARDQDQKPVTISFQGQGEREVRLGYVVEAPVWKTSYRLILGAAPAPSRLQGWAIVENQTDSDWTDVQLTLVSGRPISFIQDLYRPLYIQRPVYVPELLASLGPVTYDDGLNKDRKMAMNDFGGRQESMAKASRRAAPAPAAAALHGIAGEAEVAADGIAFNGAMDPTSGVQSVANSEKLGEFFHYTVADVDLTRQRSAMLPIVTDAIQAEKVSIYNQSVQAKHPLLGAKLTNTTGKHLLGGPITVFDAGGYSGDARIDDLPPGQERLLSFAVDLEVRVIAEGRGTTSTVLGGKLVKGVLYLQRKSVATQDYVITNKSDAVRSMIIEHPLNQGWTLVDSPKPIETTETIYRFADSVPAGEGKTLKVTEQHVDWESYAITNWDANTLLNYQRSGEIPQKVRDALGKAAALKQAQTEVEQQINERQRGIQEITQEQNRIRDNMRTVDKNTQYYQRLLTKLNDQETRLDELRQEQETLRTTLEQKRNELATYINGLNIE